jgi:hypothetical protein
MKCIGPVPSTTYTTDAGTSVAAATDLRPRRTALSAGTVCAGGAY